MIPKQHTINTPYLVGPVHCYSLEIDGELVLFDTGPPTDEARNYLHDNLDLGRLKHVLITHCHVDHYGQARWLEQHSDATIYVPAHDHIRMRHHKEHLEGVYELMLAAGFDVNFVKIFMDCLTTPGNVYPDFPEHYKIIETELPAHLGIKILPCPGHSQGDLAICGESWAVTGDVMLRQIFQSPLLDIDLQNNRRFNNYHAYCASLANLAKLRDKTILPGHRESIDSVDDSLLFYLSKMLDRAMRLKEFPKNASPCSIVSRMFGINQDYPFASYSKASEIIFLRDFLDDPDRLYEATTTIGLFPAIAGKFDLAVAA